MANTPAASPTVSSTVGLKNMVIVPLTVDTEETLTYGDLQLVAGAIEASITPENADPDIQYADDIEFDVLYPDPELTFTTKMADIPLAIQEQIFGNKIDDNGVLIINRVLHIALQFITCDTCVPIAFANVIRILVHRSRTYCEFNRETAISNSPEVVNRFEIRIIIATKLNRRKQIVTDNRHMFWNRDGFSLPPRQ